MFTFAYLIGGLILGSVWMVMFLLRKDLRREMLFGSALALPFGFLERAFVPVYWDPPSLFNLIHGVGFGIESFFFAFFTGGIGASVFEFYENKRLIKVRSDHRTHIFPYILTTALFFVLQSYFPVKSMYNLSFALLAGAGYIGFKRRDLIPHVVASGLFFGLIYTFLFYLFMHLFPSYIESFYTFKNLSGMNIFGVPIEETMFALSGGACWSTFYAYINGYRTRSSPNSRS